ncbi:MAG: divalent-cation tolerance protein CutA [bacterium]|nr:divalent-cation tolerance protein CutA [bacterium]
MAQLAILYVPCPSKAVARKLARQLLSARLIGCANILPSDSIYRWRGKLVEQREHILLAKTLPKKAVAARRWIARHHPYQVPLIGQFRLAGNAPYARWLGQQLAR